MMNKTGYNNLTPAASPYFVTTIGYDAMGLQIIAATLGGSVEQEFASYGYGADYEVDMGDLEDGGQTFIVGGNSENAFQQTAQTLHHN